MQHQMQHTAQQLLRQQQQQLEPLRLLQEQQQLLQELEGAAVLAVLCIGGDGRGRLLQLLCLWQ
jgi:hypothetical protein